MAIANIFDLRELSKSKVPKMAYDYINGGSLNELTFRRNEEAFRKILLKQYVMRNVANVSTEIKILGFKQNHPVLFAPVSLHKLSHEAGEIGTAKAAEKSGTTMILSTLSSTSLEEVAKASSSPKWFQLYWFKNKELTKNLVSRAEDNGYQVICLTVDAPVLGKREKDVHNSFNLPSGIELENFTGLEQSLLPDSGLGEGSGLSKYVSDQFNASITWNDLDWLQSITNLPILLKGIQTREDAKKCLDYQIQGMVVSNHGGRQLDNSLASIECLSRVTETVGKELIVLLDSGVRRGSDVFKALCLGADGVLIGRPYIWGLGAMGPEGVVKAVEIVVNELKEVLAMVGCRSVGEVSLEYLEEKTIPRF